MSAEAAEVPGQVPIVPPSSSGAVPEPRQQGSSRRRPAPPTTGRSTAPPRPRTRCWLLFPFAFLAVYVFVVEVYLRCHSFLGCENGGRSDGAAALDVSGRDVNMRPAAAGSRLIAGKMLRGVKVSEPTRDSESSGPTGGALLPAGCQRELC